MGCDIHMVLQIKDNDEWKTTEILDIDRNYTLFGILAGVRDGTYKTISEPKGLPKDDPSIVVDEVKFLHLDYEGIEDRFWLGDHSHSYLTAKELLKYKWTDDIIGEIPEKFRQLIRDMSYIAKKDLNKVRIVFGFDS